MADSPPSPDTGDDTGVEPGRGSPPGVPRWVKVGIIALIILALLVVILTLTGIHEPRPGHGP
jgi:hypothetical protein